VIVLQEFLRCNDSIWDIAQSHLESGEELFQDLSFSFAALKHSWVLLGIVYVADVVIVDLTTSVFVQFFVGTLNECNAFGIHWAFHNSEEFIVVDCAIVILVEGAEEGLNIDISEG